jgi:hypothetical protein
MSFVCDEPSDVCHGQHCRPTNRLCVRSHLFAHGFQNVDAAVTFIVVTSDHMRGACSKKNAVPLRMEQRQPSQNHRYVSILGGAAMGTFHMTFQVRIHSAIVSFYYYLTVFFGGIGAHIAL